MSTTTIPEPCGMCPVCGYALYAGMTHHCSTAPNLASVTGKTGELCSAALSARIAELVGKWRKGCPDFEGESMHCCHISCADELESVIESVIGTPAWRTLIENT